MAKVNRPANTALAAMLAFSMATPISSAYAQDTLTHDEQPPPIEATTNNASESPEKTTTTTDTLPSLEESTTNNTLTSSEATSAKDENDNTTTQNGSDVTIKAESAPASTTSQNEISQSSTLKEGDIVIDETTFPDKTFREWVQNPANLNGAGSDGVLTLAEREAVTEIVITKKQITSLKGIELFPNITFLNAEDNHLEKVDLSGNPELLSVYLRNNKLKNIDFSHNTKLEFIEVFSNYLEKIDLSMLPNLKFAHLDWNKLKVIDLSKNTKLEGDGFVGNNNPLEKVILPTIPGKTFDTFVISELNTFEGYSSTLPQWYTTSDFQDGTGFTPSTIQDQTSQPFNGQTLYAKRTPNTYTIQFNSNGGEGSIDPIPRTWDDGLSPLPSNTFNRLGYRFIGWSTDPNSSTASYKDLQEVENIGGAKDTNATVTLYAVWEPIEESSGYFRDQLNSTQQSLYDDLASQLPELTNPNDPGSVELYVPAGQENSLGRVLFAVLRDHPEYFWIDFSKLSWQDLGNMRYALDVKPSYDSYFVDGFTAENLSTYQSQFEQKVTEIVANAPTDPVLAVRYFNQWLVQNNTYNSNGIGASNFSRTAASGILSNNDSSQGPVCYGYATAMKVLLDRAGIENAYIEGWAYNGNNGTGEQHAWNYVAIDGAWYAIDPTWNDSPTNSSALQETYFLVGSSTTTTPNLPNRESFGANHDPSKSPAANYQLGYPSLSSDAYQATLLGKFEVINSDGSTTYATLDDALNAASDGNTVRLWDNATLKSSVTVTNDVILDTNGNTIDCGTFSITVPSDATLTVTNSTETQSEIKTNSGGAFNNNGTLKVDPFIKIKSNTLGSSAVQGNEPSAGTHTYLYAAPNKATYQAYLVLEPLQPSPSEVDLANLSSNTGQELLVSDLVSYVQTSGKPSVVFYYQPNSNNTVAVPNQAPLEWTLVSGPEITENKLVAKNALSNSPLTKGTYTFKASAYNYDLSYEITVTNKSLESYIEQQLSEVKTAVDNIEQQAAQGEFTRYDTEMLTNAFVSTKENLGSANSQAEADSLLNDLREQINSIPSTKDRAGEVKQAWRNLHGETVNLATEGSVTFNNASTLLAASQAALQDAQADNLIGISSFPEGMTADDKNLIAKKAIELLQEGGAIEKLSALEQASQWAQNAQQAISQLPDSPSTQDIPMLQALLTSYDALSSPAAALVNSDATNQISELIEQAIASGLPEGSTDPDPNPSPKPDPDPSPNPNPDPGHNGSNGSGSSESNGSGGTTKPQTPESSGQSGNTSGSNKNTGNAAESNATEATGEISLTNTQEPNKEQSETAQNNGETSNVGFMAGAAGLLAALAAGATAGIRRKLKK